MRYPLQILYFGRFNPLSPKACLISIVEFDVNATGFDLARRITVPRTHAMMANGMALASKHKTCLLEMPGWWDWAEDYGDTFFLCRPFSNYVCF